MQLDCEHTKMTRVNSCGESMADPCCHLQDVIHEMREEDIINICQHSKVSVTTASTLKIHVNVSKSITFTTSSVNGLQEAGLWYVQFEIKGTSRKPCTLALLGSHFQRSRIAVRNMNILIKDSIFTNSYADFRSQGNGYVEINNTGFNLTNENANTSPANKSLYFINVMGNWTTVKLSSSSLIGKEMNTSSGIRIAAADMESVMVNNIEMSQLFFALTVDSITTIVTFDMHDSIINGNMDGVNLNQAALYVRISGCIFEGTGTRSFSERNRCSVAFKASTIAMQVIDSLFKHNLAVGKYCDGSALSITTARHERATSAMKQAVSDQLLLQHPLLMKIQNSSFLENSVVDCKLNYIESNHDLQILEDCSHGGAVVVLGEGLQIQVVNSTFVANKGCQGAGLYIGTLSPNKNITFAINIVTCIFGGNEAHFGGGLMLAAVNVSAHENKILSVNLDNSTFLQNLARSGAGGFIYFKNVSLQDRALLWLSINTCIFQGNEATGTIDDVWQSGGGMLVFLRHAVMGSSSSLRMNLEHSHFQNNTAKRIGGGMLIIYMRHVLHETNASKVFHTRNHLFEGNKGRNSEYAICQSSLDFSNSTCHAIYLKACTFITNVGSIEGGGFSLQQSEMTQEKGTLNTLMVESCAFLSNEAQGKGGALSIFVWNLEVHDGATYSINFYKCNLTSNFARDVAAGISIYQGYSCILPETTVIFSHCSFINNSVFNQGASLHFSISVMMRVEILHGIFIQNSARIGSGVYREKAVTPSCFADCTNHSLQVMLISHSLFDDNLNTAILIDGGEGYCKDVQTTVKSCMFQNNKRNETLFGEDIYCGMNLEIFDTQILKNNAYGRSSSINTLARASVRNVSINIIKASPQQHIQVASFAEYVMTVANVSTPSLVANCPLFYYPELFIGGTSLLGSSMVRLSCKSCLDGYHIGKSSKIIAGKQLKGICNTFDILNVDGSLLAFITILCHNNVSAKCIECPLGATCSAGVNSQPNFWGYRTQSKRLEFHRCPPGYCCNKSPCQGINQCAANREGTLCGKCSHNFSESLFSTECIPDENCTHIWIIPLFCFWTFSIAFIMIFLQSLLNFGGTLISKLKTKWCSTTSDMHDRAVSEVPEEPGGQNQSTSTNNPSEMQNESRGQTMSQKHFFTPLWGILQVHQHNDRKGSSSAHKYLQIALYYLQDISLMQVNLALVSEETTLQKVRKLLLNVSQLAVDVLDLGLKLCPIRGWSPVVKLVAKNLTGPMVFLILLVVFVIVKAVCFFLPTKKASIKTYWYPKLASAAILSLLLFYQQIANTTFSLLYCIQSGNRSILFIDGTVSCYQPWQVVIIIFAFIWVVSLIPVLIFLPGLLELHLINVKDFFLSCTFPGPMMLYWGYRFYRRKFSFHSLYRTVWQAEALEILQKSYVKTTFKKCYPFCWLGFMKIRRLALVLIFTFVSNLVVRVSLMSLIILLFLILHLSSLPYEDHLANKAYTASLVATLCIGFINVMKAACVEFYLDLDKVRHSLDILNYSTDAIIVYCPLVFLALTVILFILRKLRVF